MHEGQKDRDGFQTGGGQKSGKEEGQQDPVRDTDLHAVLISGAELLGCQDGEAGGEPHGKSEHQKRDRAGRADSSKRRRSQKPAYNDRIRHIIELLEDITDHKRDRKFEYDGQDPAPGHILRHGLVVISCGMVL